MRNIFRSTLFATTALSVWVLGAGLTVPAPVQAADPQADDLKQVVVTARRVEELLQDVPISMTVYDQQQLTDMNVRSGVDLALMTPSLAVNSQFGTENAAFSLRGFGQDIGTAPTVGVFFADVVAPRGGVSTSQTQGGSGAGPGNFFDLTNVQVLKGPQGTLFGRNTTGGDVLLVPQKPTDKFEGYFETSYGNDNMEHQQGVLNLPISDKVRMRFGVDQESRDGYMKNISGVGPSNFNDINYVAGRISLDIDVTDAIENYTIASFSQSDTNGPMEKLFACNTTNVPGSFNTFVGPMACDQIARDQGKYTVENGFADAESFERQWQVINNTSWRVNDDLAIKNIASYSQLTSFVRSSLFGDDFKLPSTLLGFVPFGSLTGQHYYFTGDDTLPGGLGSNEQTVTDEVQAHGVALNQRLDWQAGAYIEDSFPRGVAGADGPTLVTCTNYLAQQCVDPLSLVGVPSGNTHSSTGFITYRDYAFYGQGTYTISDTLKFTGGIRETYDSVSSRINLLAQSYPVPFGPAKPGCNNLPPSIGSLATNCLLSLSTASHAPTWEMDLDWTPQEDMMTYVKYSRGYRAGGLTPTGPIDPTIGTQYLAFQPEHVDTYEVGLKNSFHGTIPGRFDVAAFYNDFTDQQLLTGFNSVAATPTAAITNAGASKIYGFEMSLLVKPVQSVSLNLDYTYLNSRIDSVTNPTLPTTSLYQSAPQAVPGAVLPYTPHNKFSVTAVYKLPVDAALGKMSIGATNTYTGTQAINPTLTYCCLKSYDLTNLNLNWESVYGHPVDAEFFVTNLFDRYYKTYIFDQTAVLGFASDLIGEPRMFGARLRAHF